MTCSDRWLLTFIVVALGLGLAREVSYRQQLAASKPAMVVEVRGEVLEPQLVALPHGARVIHAISLCGGLTARASITDLTLAEPLRDGQTIEVRVRDQGPPGQGPAPEVTQPTTSISEGRVDLNQADLGQLETLPAVGPVLARRIVEARQKQGGRFASLEDLAAIRGIKGKTLSRLRPHIKIEGL